MNSFSVLDELIKSSFFKGDDVIRNNVLLSNDCIEVLDKLHGDDFMRKLIVVFIEKVGKFEVQD